MSIDAPANLLLRIDDASELLPTKLRGTFRRDPHP